jgi:hypothetical protein
MDNKCKEIFIYNYNKNDAVWSDITQIKHYQY